MQTPREHPPNALAALAEWVMVLPATVLLTAAALRLLQPPAFEPAHTSWAIFNWASAHISRSFAAILFLGLPGIAVSLGSLILIRSWRRDAALRRDTFEVLMILRRHFVVGSVIGAALLASGILSLAIAHRLTD